MPIKGSLVEKGRKGGFICSQLSRQLAGVGTTWTEISRPRKKMTFSGLITKPQLCKLCPCDWLC